jgi:multiple sugar transport system substrate-binding protein
MSKLKFLVIILLGVVVAYSLIPAKAQEGNEPIITPVACAEPGTLTMWVWDEGWGEVIGNSIEQWKENYCPGAEIDLQVVPWGEYWNILTTNAPTGELPDVFNMSQDRFYFYASNNVLLDLQPYWDAAGVDTTLWGTGLVDPYRWGEDGNLLAGPVNWDTIAIYYNKDMFEAAGLEMPTAEWTWDDFAAAARTLNNSDEDVYGAAVYLEYQSGYSNWIAATGTTPVVEAGRERCTLQDEGSLEALNFLKELYDEGVMPSVSIIGGPSADDAFNYWTAGRVAMVTGGSWKLGADALEDVSFDWDVVQLPRNPETGRSRSILHSVGYVANRQTENPDLAANLILYLVSDEGQRFFAEAGGVAPANPNSELQQLWMDSFGETDVNIQAFVDATIDSQGVTAFGEIWDAINTEITLNIFDLGLSAEDATQLACEFIDTQLPE